jgi:hypothetical protein
MYWRIKLRRFPFRGVHKFLPWTCRLHGIREYNFRYTSGIKEKEK